MAMTSVCGMQTQSRTRHTGASGLAVLQPVSHSHTVLLYHTIEFPAEKSLRDSHVVCSCPGSQTKARSPHYRIIHEIPPPHMPIPGFHYFTSYVACTGSKRLEARVVVSVLVLQYNTTNTRNILHESLLFIIFHYYVRLKCVICRDNFTSPPSVWIFQLAHWPTDESRPVGDQLSTCLTSLVTGCTLLHSYSAGINKTARPTHFPNGSCTESLTFAGDGSHGQRHNHIFPVAFSR